jgi:hypothetical protein
MPQAREYRTILSQLIRGEPYQWCDSQTISNQPARSRWIKAFDRWLFNQNYLQDGETVFGPSISEKVPEWIAMWILDE